MQALLRLREMILTGELLGGARIAQRNLREAVKNQCLDQVPGVRLIRKRS